jgi:predicted nucleotidyltransferase
MTELDALAQEVGVHGRTLRRAAARGLLRAGRRGAREVTIPPSERSYVRARWQLLSRLLEALRTRPNARLAVVFGSVAGGTEQAESDLDVLVRLRIDDHRARAELVDGLQEASGRRVQLVSFEQAQEAPLLLADVLRDGRVLVDRDGDWSRLRRRERQIVGRAREEDERLQRAAWEAPHALEQIARRMTIASG